MKKQNTINYGNVLAIGWIMMHFACFDSAIKRHKLNAGNVISIAARMLFYPIPSIFGLILVRCVRIGVYPFRYLPVIV